ncbi:forkhead box protein M1 isoform X2 [Tiliqua scincoides]|uniref:forkhead box protein M1 isoform X2 n=1 Tax=Tiliqua scincoides TaxID=71010 RepID=UPI003461FB26
MKSSPHRPLILKRRKLSLSHGNTSCTLDREEPSRQGSGSPTQEHGQTNKHSTPREGSGTQEVPAGIKMVNHPTMPNTQVVAIPATADIRMILEALTAKGKESGSSGPNKFILISSGSSTSSGETGAFKNWLQLKEEHSFANTTAWEGEKHTGQNSGTVEESAVEASELQPELEGNSSDEAPSCGLDNSLTNIQWLGKMSSDGLSPCTVKKETEKENLTPKPQAIKTEEGSTVPSSAASWPESFSERPPYSYMAMIQFAINSTERKRMMLKDIYAWIEDHFPYFKHVAKPGWKNSIRHNLSLHNMFVRETSANGKISFWTIHPEANRYLTLDQVFKPLDAGSSAQPEPLESQQKRPTPDLPKDTSGPNGGSRAEPQTPAARRKMKPLLPRVNSYLVPVRFPMSQSLVLQPPSGVPLPSAQSTAETMHSIQQVRIAPKVLPSCEEPAPHAPVVPIKEEACRAEESAQPASCQSAQVGAPWSCGDAFPAGLRIKQESDSFHSSEWASSVPPPPVKEEPSSSLVALPAPPPAKPKSAFSTLKSPPPHQRPSDMLVIKRRERHEAGRSRRKQQLSRPCAEEPVLVLPPSSGSDPFMLGHPIGHVAHLSCSQEEGGPFKTPVKEALCSLPISSTPGKTPTATPPSLAAADPWKAAPFVKEVSGLDLSPTRTPPPPFQENLDLLGFSSTPLRQPLFDSPQLPLLHAEANTMVSGPWTSSPASSKQPSPELQASVLPENRSLLEGLVLDTMNDSLSKILLEASFPSFEDDSLDTDLSWSQLIPELK